MNRHPNVNVPTSTNFRDSHFRARATHQRDGYTPDAAAGGDAAISEGQKEQTTTGAVSPGTVLSGGVLNIPDEGDATVVIDKDGITINDGALTIQDEFGKSVLGASGFEGSWSDFINLGLYNARFLANTVGTVPVGRTVALPYWTRSAVTGSPDLDTLSTGGVQFVANALNDKTRLLSDAIPVRPGTNVAVPLTITNLYSVAGPLFVIDTTIEWYTDDAVTPAPLFPTSAMDSVSSGSAITNEAWDLTPVAVPGNARYARVRHDISEILAHSHSNALVVVSTGLRESPPENLNGLDLQVGTLSANAGNLSTVGDLDLGGRVIGSNDETTFTPTVTNDGTATYTLLTMTHQRVGDVVFFAFEMVINAAGAGGGSITISLPYTVGVRNQIVGGGFVNGFGAGIANGNAFALLSAGSSVMAIRDRTSATLSRADFVAAAICRISGSYLV